MQSIRKGFEAVMAFVQVITFQNVRHLLPNRVEPSSSYLPRLWSSWQGPAGSLLLWCLPPAHPGCEAKVYKPLTWDKGKTHLKIISTYCITYLRSPHKQKSHGLRSGDLGGHSCPRMDRLLTTRTPNSRSSSWRFAFVQWQAQWFNQNFT